MDSPRTPATKPAVSDNSTTGKSGKGRDSATATNPSKATKTELMNRAVKNPKIAESSGGKRTDSAGTQATRATSTRQKRLDSKEKATPKTAEGTGEAKKPPKGNTNTDKAPKRGAKSSDKPPKSDNKPKGNKPAVDLKRRYIDGDKYPESALARMDAHGPNAKGKYSYVGTLDRPGADARRKEATGHLPTKKGYQRDETREAMFKEGGKGTAVTYITGSDNGGSGASLGHQMNGKTEGYSRIPDGQSVRVFVKPPSDAGKAALARGRMLYGEHEAK
jgi:hypothetical protein